MISGKIAHVLSEYEVAFNVGAEDGVEQGDRATICRFVEIRDPDSAEVLGEIKQAVMRTRVVKVAQKFSVGRSLLTSRSVTGVTASRPIRRRFTTDPSEVDEQTLFVRVGDPVDIERAQRPATTS